MIFDVFSSKNSDVYRIAYSSIACIYTYFSRKLYNDLSVRFFPYVVTQKRIFFLCSLFVTYNINILLEKKEKKAKSNQRVIEKMRERVYSMYSCIYAIRYTKPKSGVFA